MALNSTEYWEHVRLIHAINSYDLQVLLFLRDVWIAKLENLRGSEYGDQSLCPAYSNLIEVSV